MNLQNRPITSIQQVQNEGIQKKPVRNTGSSIGSNQFDSILKQQLGKQQEVKFSKHANQRLQSRNIELTSEQKLKLNQGIESASAKGIKDSLVLMDNVALVVNVPSKTVVTALSKQESSAHVFTNIDGAVVI